MLCRICLHCRHEMLCRICLHCRHEMLCRICLHCPYEMLCRICLHCPYEMLCRICLHCRYEMLYRICLVQIQLRKHAPGHADYTAPTRQHEVRIHTDHESIYIRPVWQIKIMEAGIGDLCEVCLAYAP